MAKPPPPRRPSGPAAERPQYTLYRARPRLLDRLRRRDSTLRGDRIDLDELRRERAARAAGPRPRARRWTARRVLRRLVLAALAWAVLSLVLFLVSAHLERSKISDEARAALDGGGFPPVIPTTVLVLGSDERTKQTAEPGAVLGAAGRADSILLVRTGGGHSARLSIPRDTVVDIPGHGRNKINAAYSIGGAPLAVATIRQYLGIKVNHLVEVDFANFPRLIDAMGGIDYRGGCVVSRINGGFRNGGYTLRLPRGKSHLDGRQALALARTRHNLCNPREDDRTRALRQQKIIAAMKHRLLSPFAFLRLPLISWNAPKALRSDMGGPTLLGLFAALAASGSPPALILHAAGNVVLPDGSAGLVVDEAERQREVQRFLRE